MAETGRKHLRVVCVLVMKDGKVLVAQRPPHKSYPGMWEFPGGKVEKGEKDPDAVAREIREELSIGLSGIRYLGETFHDYPEFTVDLLFYRADWSSGDLLATEHPRIEWCYPRDLERYDFLPGDLEWIRRFTRVGVK